MSHKIQATLLAFSNSVDLEAEVNCDSYTFTMLCFDLITLFGGSLNSVSQKIEVKSPVQNTKALKDKVDQFIEKYNFFSITIYRLRTYLQGLKNDEYIIFHWGAPPTREQGLSLYSLLFSLNDRDSPNQFGKIYDSLFADFLAKYDVHSFQSQSRKMNIGEVVKTKRICRFCNNQREIVTFKNKAHAISESLGNKTIILNEECDKCNLEFGSGIERDLIAYLKPFVSIFGIRGKTGIPTYKGKNFSLSRNKEGGINLDYFSTTGEKKGKSPVTLKTFDHINTQNIYRTLCKYALSVIDREHLTKFEETLVWIKGENDVGQLPSIAVLKSLRLFTSQPTITISIRTENDLTKPFAVGEFRCTYLTFVFIIPLNKEDKKDFTDKKDYDNFWHFFKHYNSTNGWEFLDFSNNKKREYIIQMDIENPNKYSIRQGF